MLSQIELLQVNRCVEQILHTPGNEMRAENVLEMAFVIDEGADGEYVVEVTGEIAGSLKKHSDTFRNVRCNLVRWGTDGDIMTEVMPLAFVQMGRAKARPSKGVPNLEELLGYLKLYHARAKCIILVTQGEYAVGHIGTCIEHMNPFLKRKLLVLKEHDLIMGSRFYMDLCSRME